MALERLPTIEDAGLYQRSEAAPFLQFGNQPDGVMSSPTMDVETDVDTAPVLNAEQQRMQELDRMLQEAQSRADIVEREAYDKAYAAGEKSGFSLGEKRAEQTLEQLQQLLQQTELQLNALDCMCREAVLDISEAVVSQLLADMSEKQHDMLMKAVEKVAFQFPNISDLLVLVNPNDIQSFEALLPSSMLSESRIRAQADVEEGSCRLMSEKQDVLVHPSRALRESFDVLRQKFSA